jgi:hypothetical protein
MYLEVIGDTTAESLLDKAGYEEVGKGLVFRRFLTETIWFHAIIQPDKKGIKIHLDIAKKKLPERKTKFQYHSSQHRTPPVMAEVDRIKRLLQ